MFPHLESFNLQKKKKKDFKLCEDKSITTDVLKNTKLVRPGLVACLKQSNKKNMLNKRTFSWFILMNQIDQKQELKVTPKDRRIKSVKEFMS